MHHEDRKAVLNSAHPGAWEAKEADPTWVEQEGISRCLKLPASPTTNLKAETFAGESWEEGAKHSVAGAAGLGKAECHVPIWHHHLCDKGQGWLHALLFSAPAFGTGMWNARSRQCLLPSLCPAGVGWGIFMTKGMFGEVWYKSPLSSQFFRKDSLLPFLPLGHEL